MSIDATRTQIIARIWQAVAQSSVDLSSLPQEQQDKLVSKIADQMIFTLNELLDDVPRPSPAQDDKSEKKADEFQEEILWKGRPFLSLVENYTITNERLKIVRGLFAQDVEYLELVRVQDIDLSRSITDRMFNLGDIDIRGADLSNAQFTLRNISDAEAVYELLRRAWLEARKRYGLQFREQM
ncbi:MAG: rane-flanked domain [Chloroflexi bacterium]|jgi:uncharacterized protein YjbI with pentapeptide repeats|nr:rane-flanked domain [Chloroflexota bacterium]